MGLGGTTAEELERERVRGRERNRERGNGGRERGKCRESERKWKKEVEDLSHFLSFPLCLSISSELGFQVPTINATLGRDRYW